MSASIRNCVFAFKCTRAWEGMRKTDSKNIRFCEDCQREVHFCRDSRSLSHAIALNRCVAIVVEDIEHDGSGHMLLGEVVPPYGE